MEENTTDASSLKESGNMAFKAGRYSEALQLYNRSLALLPADDKKEMVAVLKNLAACYLKMQDYEQCATVASQALELSPNDPKALFRRCQAYEQVNRLDEAYRDARLVAHAEPKDAAVRETLDRLHRKLDDLTKQRASTEKKVADMMKFFLSSETDIEKRRQVAKNLIVLAREKSGAEQLMERQVPEQLVKMLRDSKLDSEIRMACVRVLGELYKGDVVRCRELLRKRIGLPPLLNLYTVDNEELATAVSVAVENILKTLSGWIDKEKPDKAMIKENQDDIDHTMESLLQLTDRAVLSARGRDEIIDIILKNIQQYLSPGIGWTVQFLERQGIIHLLRVAVSQPGDFTCNPSALRVTDETRTHVALALQKVYEDLDGDKLRTMFREQCEGFVQELLQDPDPRSRVQVVLAIIALLQGPLEVGNYLLGTKGILEVLLSMAGSDDTQQQLVAAEAIVHAASKKDKCAAILGDGLSLLHKLLQSPNEKVQVRALVGLCKVGSAGGIDASQRNLPAETMQKLADQCRKFLLSGAETSADLIDLRRWAAEGLAYLTLDAEVKETLIQDRPALRNLIQLGRTGNQNVVYGVVSALANLANAYEKPDVVPELKQLAEFAKQHVPVEHPKDSAEFVTSRVTALMEEGAGSALVALSSCESQHMQELISRIFNVVAETKENRGHLVQQGAAKALIKLALTGSAKGKEQAGQALARIGITINPELAFPGQRSCEVIRPLLNLLDVEKGALQNFEALLALTNLAQLSESVRARIARDGGLAKVEHYVYEEHEMLRRAATECICNLMLSPEVQDMFIKSQSDRVKLLLLFSVDEDPAVARAASGALAILSQNPHGSEKIIEPGVWLDVMKEISVSENGEVRVRGLFVLGQLIEKSEKAAEAICQCELLEILMATSQLSGESNQQARQLALKALKAAHKRKLIAPNPAFEELDEEDAEEKPSD